MTNDNGRKHGRFIDITTVLNILLSNSTDEVKPVLHAAIAEIKMPRQFPAAVLNVLEAKTEEAKEIAWQTLVELCK